MNNYYIFNENGEYTGNRGVQATEINYTSIQETPETRQLMTDLVKPILKNGTIVEGATQEEVNEFNRQFVPSEVALWKLRFILSQIGLEQAVSDAIAQLPEPQKTAATYIWNFGTAIERISPTVSMIKHVLRLNDTQADEIFISANQITL